MLRLWEGNVRVDTEETGCEDVKLSNVPEDCSKGKHWYLQFEHLSYTVRELVS